MESKKRSGWSPLELGLLSLILVLCLGTAGLGVFLGSEYLIGSQEAQATATPSSGDAEATPTGDILGPPVTGGDQPGSGSAEDSNATLDLSPEAGSPGSTVTVRGEGWPAGTRVVISLVPSNPPNYAVNSAVVNNNGAFAVDMIVPSDPRWLEESPVPVLAEDIDQGVTVQTLLNIVSPSSGQPEPTPSAPDEDFVPTEPTPTPPPPPVTVPQLTTTTNLNVRRGPGTSYDILGVLLEGQKAEITGRDADATWWQIKFDSAPEGRGWVAARYATAINIADVPIVNMPAPPTPPPPVPTPTPPPGLVITDWRGEYYSNPDLAGAPVLVRNDVSISFDWGLGSPAPEVPADNFSVRWTRRLNFTPGAYRFYARADDGLRLFVDNALLLNEWRDSSPTTYAAEVYLTGGDHDLRLEYYERGGGALGLLSWERLTNYPDWKAEYYSNPNLQGAPVLVRNEPSINYNWGRGSPGTGLPADNFSARWSRAVDLERGDYRLRVHADDGVRVWVDNSLVIDQWRDGDTGVMEIERKLSSGRHQLRVEYYERGGNAFIGLAIDRRDDPDDPPTAVIKSPSESVIGQPILFDGSRSRRGDSQIVRFEWDFGDGASTRGEQVFHTYDQPGEYRVKLTVTDRNGLRDSTRVSIDLKDDLSETEAPNAVMNAPTAARAGDTLNFDASRSTSVSSIIAYQWNFGDGSGAEGRTVNHSYSKPGLYNASLTVVAQNGLRNSVNQTIRIDSAVSPQPPVARIAAPATGQVGQQLFFDGTGSTGSARLAGYDWNFGDGATASGAQVQHTYSRPGNYQVSLTVTDENGRSNTAYMAIRIIDAPPAQPPQVNLSGPAQAQINQQVTFDGSGAVASTPLDEPAFIWNFGDGATGAGRTVNHVYPQAGQYEVSLTVSDQNGLSGSASVMIEITPPPPPPVAVIVGPDRAIVNQSVTFDAATSKVATQIVNFAWDFGDGHTATNAAQVTHAYTAPGSYPISLTLTDEFGQTGSATKAVTVEEAPAPSEPPVALISGPSSAQVGQMVTFDASSSAQGSSPVATMVWDFGDGSTDSSGSIKIDHAYETAGNYQVTLTLTDQAGQEGIGVLAIQVEEVSIQPQPTVEPTPEPEDNPPLAVFNGPETVTVGETASFDGGFSYGDNAIVDWLWDFGDSATGSGMGVDHVYTAPGGYAVILTVTDDQGLSGTSAPFVVTVNDLPPTPTPPPPTPEPQPQLPEPPTPEPQPQLPEPPQETPTPEPAPPSEPRPTPEPAPTPTPEPPPANPPVAAFEAPPTAEIGQPLNFDGGFSYGEAPLVQWLWNFGDGSSGDGMGITHVFNSPGQYQVTLTVIDANGRQGSSTAVVTVNAPASAPELQPRDLGPVPEATPPADPE
jgi:PKD repeat protein